MLGYLLKMLINIFVNIIDLVGMYSISRGKFSIPKIWNAKKAIITGVELIESKQRIERLYFKMKKQNH